MTSCENAIRAMALRLIEWNVSGYSELRDDGMTACGCWVYSGVFPEPGRNRANERKITDNPIQPEWGFAWPNNVRVLYNRASADPDGRPWSERKKLVWWDSEKRRWVGLDKPDFVHPAGHCDQQEPERVHGFRHEESTLSPDHRQCTAASAIPLLSMQIDFPDTTPTPGSTTVLVKTLWLFGALVRHRANGRVYAISLKSLRDCEIVAVDNGTNA